MDTGGDIEIESHQGSSSDTSYTESICLEDGEYKFIISDSGGDGICCVEYGDGTYTVTTSDGVVIAEGGDFEESESTYFLLPFIPYPSMSPSSSLHPTTTSSPSISPSSYPTQGPQCEGSNPDICGCGSVRQSDYRGTISTTVSGKECIRWDETSFTSFRFPDSGLEDNNYCRNPKGWVERAFCITGDDYEDCDVPICEDSLPSAYPSSSPRPTTTTRSPTISPKPTTSQAPTSEPQCEGSNPEICGCTSVNQGDYRGTISTTVSGRECLKWDYWQVERYPDAGLEDNNYCRNPSGPFEQKNRAWCYTGDPNFDGEYCDVPICEDSLPSAYPSSSLHPTTSPKPTTSLYPTQGPQCEGSNPQVCGCGSVGQKDYRGTIDTTKMVRSVLDGTKV